MAYYETSVPGTNVSKFYDFETFVPGTDVSFFLFFQFCFSLTIYYVHIEHKKRVKESIKERDFMSKEQTFKRLEIKYLLSDAQYRALLPELSKYAEVDSYGLSRINNIYYDTPDFRIIRTSLEKPVYKEKLRLRTYGNTGSDTNAFVEIKKKYKGVVYKRRFESSYENAFNYLSGSGLLDKKSQVTDEVDEFLKIYPGIRPAMIIGYDRIAMAGIYDKEFRVTFDTNITWRTENLDLRYGSEGHSILEEGQHLMEIKIPDAFPLELSRRLSELEIFPASFSKYGRGYIAMLMGNVAKGFATYENTVPNPGLQIEKGEVAYA